jgi:Ca2+-binding EF-hand superfamily protein
MGKGNEKRKVSMIRRKNSMIAAAAVATVGLLAVAGTSYADRGEDDCPRSGYGGHGMHGGPGGRGGHAAMMFEKFDANGDGTITRAEVDEVRGAKLKGADGNADNALSLEEFQAVWLEMTRPMMVDRFQDLDEDGDGKVTEAELGRPMTNMFVYLDQNEDGSITVKELRGRQGKHGREYDEDHDDD